MLLDARCQFAINVPDQNRQRGSVFGGAAGREAPMTKRAEQFMLWTNWYQLTGNASLAAFFLKLLREELQ